MIHEAASTVIVVALATLLGLASAKSAQLTSFVELYPSGCTPIEGRWISTTDYYYTRQCKTSFDRGSLIADTCSNGYVLNIPECPFKRSGVPLQDYEEIACLEMDRGLISAYVTDFEAFFQTPPPFGRDDCFTNPAYTAYPVVEWGIEVPGVETCSEGDVYWNCVSPGRSIVEVEVPGLFSQNTIGRTNECLLLDGLGYLIAHRVHLVFEDRTDPNVPALVDKVILGNTERPEWKAGYRTEYTVIEGLPEDWDPRTTDITEEFLASLTVRAVDDRYQEDVGCWAYVVEFYDFTLEDGCADPNNRPPNSKANYTWYNLEDRYAFDPLLNSTTRIDTYESSEPISSFSSLSPFKNGVNSLCIVEPEIGSNDRLMSDTTTAVDTPPEELDEDVPNPVEVAQACCEAMTESTLAILDRATTYENVLPYLDVERVVTSVDDGWRATRVSHRLNDDGDFVLELKCAYRAAAAEKLRAKVESNVRAFDLGSQVYPVSTTNVCTVNITLPCQFAKATEAAYAPTALSLNEEFVGKDNAFDLVAGKLKNIDEVDSISRSVAAGDLAADSVSVVRDLSSIVADGPTDYKVETSSYVTTGLEFTHCGLTESADSLKSNKFRFVPIVQSISDDYVRTAGFCLRNNTRSALVENINLRENSTAWYMGTLSYFAPSLPEREPKVHLGLNELTFEQFADGEAASLDYQLEKEHDASSYTCAPTPAPSASPSVSPSVSPSSSPSVAPSLSPVGPSKAPSVSPSNSPSLSPSLSPVAPSTSPSVSPSESPSVSPSTSPTSPSVSPSLSPSKAPSDSPSKAPSKAPSASPTAPSSSPTPSPISAPTVSPTTQAPSSGVSTGVVVGAAVGGAAVLGIAGVAAAQFGVLGALGGAGAAAGAGGAAAAGGGAAANAVVAAAV